MSGVKLFHHLICQNIVCLVLYFLRTHPYFFVPTLTLSLWNLLTTHGNFFFFTVRSWGSKFSCNQLRFRALTGAAVIGGNPRTTWPVRRVRSMLLNLPHRLSKWTASIPWFHGERNSSHSPGMHLPIRLKQPGDDQKRPTHGGRDIFPTSFTF